MRRQRRCLTLICSCSLALGFVLMPTESRAVGQVELVLEAVKGAPITAMQDWARELGSAGVEGVRVRQQTTPGKPSIETRTVGTQKFYTVRGTIDRDGRVSVPGETPFTPGEVKRLAEWLDDLAELGPPETREPVDRFGLTLSVTKEVGVDLAIPVMFKTKGLSRAEIVRQINKTTRFKILATKTMMDSLKKDTVEEELQGFASGTVLAYLAEPFGLGLYPGKNKAGQIEYLLVERSTKPVKPWPIGWEPKNRTKALPELFKTRNVNVDRIPISQVVAEVSKRLDVPVLVDRVSLASQKIDMDKTIVSLPQARVNFDRVLGSLTGKAKLKYQLRLDDARHPFLWITTAVGK